MAVRLGNTLFFIPLLCLSPFLAPMAQANPFGDTLAPVAEAITAAVCIDPWHKTRPCRSSASLLSNTARPASLTNRWWTNLWSAAGDVAAGPQFVLGGKRVACGPGYDSESLFKLDFRHFQLNMDVDLDVEEDRFDTVRLAYRSCWR